MPVQIGQPEPGCNDPVGLMTACHRRIERFLKTLRVAAKRAGDRDLEQDELEAIGRSLTYFRNAAPKHTEDEEHDLFPALMEKQPDVATSVENLQSDHARANVLHARVDELGLQWIADRRIAPEALAEFVDATDQLEALYSAHIKHEETEVFPRASKALNDAELESIGRNMAARRGVAFVPKN
ncbi:MAG: hemerythrin domain-containing protein [Bryobacterales bacterium]|nr:hemerythrin domain-containing protein [Bryobacterales bacterium]